MIYSYNTLGVYETKANRQYDNTGNIRVLHHFETNKIPAFQVIVLGTIVTASYKLFDIDDVEVAAGSVTVENAVREDSTVYSRLIFLGTTLAGKDDGFYYMEITYTEGSISFDFNALGQTSRAWSAMASDLDGNVYASVNGGDIYLQSGGAGDFLPLSQTSRAWSGMSVNSDGDVYAIVDGGDLYVRSDGTGDFLPLSVTNRAYNDIAVYGNNIYACISGGDIYIMVIGATSDFVPLGQTSRAWSAMTASPSGDIYASVNGGDIYLQTGFIGDFIALSQTSRNWSGMASDLDGNIYAIVNGGDMYIRTGGSGDFLPVSATTRGYSDMTITPSDEIYTIVNGGDVYKYEESVVPGPDKTAYTDVFCWQTDVSEYLKIEATTSDMTIGGFEMNMAGFTYLVYLEVQENGFTEEYPVEEEGVAKTYGNVAYFNSRNHEQQFEITGYKKTLGFLSGLRTVHTNGIVTITYKNDINEIDDIETPDAAQSYTYSDILIINWKFKLKDYLQTRNEV